MRPAGTPAVERDGSAPRRILVSGGTSGIGRACAERLAGRGASVWVLGSGPDGVDRARRELRLAGASVCDVSVESDVEAAVAAACSTMGGIDGVFVNAGIDGEGVAAVDLDVAHLRRVLEVNVVGAFLVARSSLRVLARPGAIVLNASVNALRPEVGFVDYNASKAAVVSIAKSLALEVSAEGVSVTAICPGYFPTRMTAPYLDDPATREELLARIPARRFGTLEEIAALVEFLLGPDAGYLTGSTISIDGGSGI